MSMIPDSLMEYLGTQPEYIRDVILEHYMRGKLVKAALDDPIGKTILNEVITAIRDKVMAIVKAASGKPGSDRTAVIDQLASEIKLLNEMLERWAKVIQLGDSYEAEAKGRRK